MGIQHRLEKRLCIFFISGNLSLNEVDDVKKYINPFIEDPELDGILFNCAELHLIDSTGVGWLTTVLQALDARQKTFSLCQLPDKCLRIFHSMGFNKLFDIYTTEESAIAALT